MSINCNETSKISKKTSYLKKTKKAGNLIYLEESVQTVKSDMVDLSQLLGFLGSFSLFLPLLNSHYYLPVSSDVITKGTSIHTHTL